MVDKPRAFTTVLLRPQYKEAKVEWESDTDYLKDPDGVGHSVVLGFDALRAVREAVGQRSAVGGFFMQTANDYIDALSKGEKLSLIHI